MGDVLLNAEQVAERLGRGERQTREAIKRGQIPSVAFGSARLVPVAALDAWLASAGNWQPPAPIHVAAERAKRRSRHRAEKQTEPQTYAQRLFARNRP